MHESWAILSGAIGKYKMKTTFTRLSLRLTKSESYILEQLVTSLGENPTRVMKNALIYYHLKKTLENKENEK